MAWQPKTILRLEECIPSSSNVFRVVTDAGKGYLKTLGNPEGPRSLICEWVAWHLAQKLRLTTFDATLINIAPEDELPFPKGGFAAPGPAFITKAENGTVWGGSQIELRKLVNPEDLARLVVFDTWLRNRDRCPPPGAPWHNNLRNVFLSFEDVPADRACLKAMDHTHCFTWSPTLSVKIAMIDEWQDERIYGRFVEFEPWLTRERVVPVLEDLKLIKREQIVQILASVPPEWQLDGNVREAMVNFLMARAGWLGDNLESLLFPQRELPLQV